MLHYALGTITVVEKQRDLYLYRHTRIHLDRVKGLGTFVELETVVTTQSDEEAARELRDVASALGVDQMTVVPCAYADLLRGQ